MSDTGNASPDNLDLDLTDFVSSSGGQVAPDEPAGFQKTITENWRRNQGLNQFILPERSASDTPAMMLLKVILTIPEGFSGEGDDIEEKLDFHIVEMLTHSSHLSDVVDARKVVMTNAGIWHKWKNGIILSEQQTRIFMWNGHPLALTFNGTPESIVVVPHPSKVGHYGAFALVEPPTLYHPDNHPAAQFHAGETPHEDPVVRKVSGKMVDGKPVLDWTALLDWSMHMVTRGNKEKQQ